MLKPLGENVIVLLKKAEEKSAGGVYLPDQAKDKQPRPTEGEVLAIGPDVTWDGGVAQFKVGDTVLFSAYAGVKAKDGDRDVAIMKRGELLAVQG